MRTIQIARRAVDGSITGIIGGNMQNPAEQPVLLDGRDPGRENLQCDIDGPVLLLGLEKIEDLAMVRLAPHARQVLLVNLPVVGSESGRNVSGQARPVL